MLDTKGQKSLVIVGVLKDAEMAEGPVHLIKSVYPYDDIIKRLTTFAEQGKLIITNKKRANEILERIGVQPSERKKSLTFRLKV